MGTVNLREWEHSWARCRPSPPTSPLFARLITSLNTTSGQASPPGGQSSRRQPSDVISDRQRGRRQRGRRQRGDQRVHQPVRRAGDRPAAAGDRDRGLQRAGFHRPGHRGAARDHLRAGRSQDRRLRRLGGRDGQGGRRRRGSGLRRAGKPGPGRRAAPRLPPRARGRRRVHRHHRRGRPVQPGRDRRPARAASSLARPTSYPGHALRAAKRPGIRSAGWASGCSRSPSAC